MATFAGGTDAAQRGSCRGKGWRKGTGCKDAAQHGETLTDALAAWMFSGVGFRSRCTASNGETVVS